MKDIERMTFSEEELVKIYSKTKSGRERLVLAIMEVTGLRVEEATKKADALIKDALKR